MAFVPGVPATLPRHGPVLETTADLLTLIRNGDERARDRLVRRYLHRLQRLAHGRLPALARGLVDTDDLVQLSLIRALKHVERLELHREGAFLAYLRKVLLNQIRTELRRARRRPECADGVDSIESSLPSPLEQAVGADALTRWERALASLTEEQRAAVILRVELGFPYRMIAETLTLPSANAARMTIQRALVRMMPSMRER